MKILAVFLNLQTNKISEPINLKPQRSACVRYVAWLGLTSCTPWVLEWSQATLKMTFCDKTAEIGGSFWSHGNTKTRTDRWKDRHDGSNIYLDLIFAWSCSVITYLFSPVDHSLIVTYHNFQGPGASLSTSFWLLLSDTIL